ncbi:MAG: hypothetical protein ACLQM8_20300, partial [Limisphaerales bacterium]
GQRTGDRTEQCGKEETVHCAAPKWVPRGSRAKPKRTMWTPCQGGFKKAERRFCKRLKRNDLATL